MNDQEHELRGRQAKEVLENPIYKEAWDLVRSRLLVAMEMSKTDEATLRGKLCLGLLNDVRRFMDRALEDGKVAAATIQLGVEEKQREEKRQRKPSR